MWFHSWRILHYFNAPFNEAHSKTSILTGPMWVHWVLTDDNKNTCYERFRMGSSTFLKLCNTLKQNGFLKSSRYVKITEQVATFILLATHSHTQKDVSDRIQRSSETVNWYCHIVLKAFCRLEKTIIRPSAMHMPHPYVMKDRCYYPWFGVSHIYQPMYCLVEKVCWCDIYSLYVNYYHLLTSWFFFFFSQKCIGAIDGIHVDANVRGENKVPYQDYKSSTSHNVLCIVDFDLCFTYVRHTWLNGFLRVHPRSNSPLLHSYRRY